MRIRSLALVLSLGVTGCAGGPSRAGGTPRAGGEPPAIVALQVLEAGPQGERPLAPGAKLHSGALLRLRVTLDRLLYVYVAAVDAGGKSAVLFPSGAARQVSAGSLLIPVEAEGLRIDPPIGAESLQLVASVRPLGQVDLGLCARHRFPCADPADVAQRGAPAEPPPPPPPQTGDITKRVPAVAWVPQEAVLRGSTDERGLLVMEFRIEQVP